VVFFVTWSPGCESSSVQFLAANLCQFNISVTQCDSSVSEEGLGMKDVTRSCASDDSRSTAGCLQCMRLSHVHDLVTSEASQWNKMNASEN
jgi:hypothetical protein